jgi:hypothetical protein
MKPVNARTEWLLDCLFVIMSLTALFAVPAAAQSQNQLQLQPQIQLPSAAHKVGETAGFYTDPMTRNKVYRLSDGSMCPGGGSHIYSWSTEFSKQGKMLVKCDQGKIAAPLYLVYDKDFKLLTKDVLNAAGAPPSLRFLQWSQGEEVLYGKQGTAIYRLDPGAKKTKVFAVFQVTGAVGIREFWVGPKDRIVADVHRGGDWAIIAVAVFDPETGKYSYWDPEGKEVHQATLTQNPAGRVLVSLSSGGQLVFPTDFKSRYAMPKGHYGFLPLLNGRYGILKPDGECPGAPFWKFRYALRDDETGEVLLHFGCDVPGQHAWDHFGRSISTPNTFSVTTNRYPFPPSRDWQPTYEAVLIGRVLYEGDLPKAVEVTPVAYHRSAAGERAKAQGRDCGYWAYPRGVLDHTATRVLFDSTMSHPEWPALDGDGKIITTCRPDVYVVVKNPAP